MTKIRSKDEFSSFITADLAWRKRELVNLKVLIEENNKQHDFMMRLAVPFLYAQWEGFIKYAGIAYLNYITYLGKNISQVKQNFVAMAVKKHAKIITNQPSVYKNFEELVNFLQSNEKISFLDEEIDTKSNLNGDVFKEIMQKLGLDYQEFSAQKHTIIEPLITARNKIAHGNRESMPREKFDEIYKAVLNMLDMFKTQVENAVYTESFLKEN